MTRGEFQESDRLCLWVALVDDRVVNPSTSGGSGLTVNDLKFDPNDLFDDVIGQSSSAVVGYARQEHGSHGGRLLFLDWYRVVRGRV